MSESVGQKNKADTTPSDYPETNDPQKIYLGKSAHPHTKDDKQTGTKGTPWEYLHLKFANRHGLVTGATGTGKTVTLQVLAEALSDRGVPVFAADIKGDLSGIAMKGEPKDFLVKRAADVGLKPYENKAHTVIFWDVFGEQGHPVRATVLDMGPLLLSRMLELNEVQEGVLNVAFRVAADEKMPVLDLKDLRALIVSVAERAKELTTKYGNVATTSVGAIQRRLLVLEEQGADKFFGEPALDIKDFIRTTNDGRGTINILTADKLMEKPRLYATFLLWMLTKLWQTLPEVGDQPKPKLVFFFDEAHLLFTDAPKALLERIEQIARLVRSKGVGVYFVTQHPGDVPEIIGAQLGNRVLHALRGFTPQDLNKIKGATLTFRDNPDPGFKEFDVIQQLKIGEALVSTLEKNGEPSIVQRTLIRPPEGRIGPLTSAERQGIIDSSPVHGRYEEAVDRESAHEMLTKRTDKAAQEAGAAEGDGGGSWTDVIFGGPAEKGRGRQPQGMGTTIAKEVQRSLTRSAGSMIARVIRRSLGLGR